MKRRTAHADERSEVLDTQRLREVSLQPIDCPRNLMTLTPRRRYLAQTLTLIAHQQTVDDLPLDDRRKDRNVLLLGKQVDQALNGGEQRQRNLAGRHATA